MADIRKETRDLLDRKVDEVFETLQDKYNIDPGDIFLVDAYVANKIEELVTDLAYYIALMLGEQAGEDDFDAFDDRVGEACDDGKCCEALDMISDMEKYLNKLKADGVNMNKLTAGNKLARQFPGASQSDIAKVVKKCKIKESKCDEDEQPKQHPPERIKSRAESIANGLEILARALRNGEYYGAVSHLENTLAMARKYLAQFDDEEE